MRSSLSAIYPRNALLVVTMTLLFPVAACTRAGRKIVDRYKNGSVLAICMYPDINDTTTFELLNYFPDGKLFKRAEIKNDQYVGEKITYYKNGKIYQIDSLAYPQSRRSEKWNGLLIRYNRNGTLSQQFVVKDGEFNGLCKQYNSIGVLKKQYYLTDDTVKNGRCEYFEDNGKLSVEMNYSNNVPNGMVYYFDANGDTAKYYYLNYNKLSYPYKQWLSDGQRVVGEFEDSSQKKVVWTWYDKYGKILKTRSGLGIKQGYYIP